MRRRKRNQNSVCLSLPLSFLITIESEGEHSLSLSLSLFPSLPYSDSQGADQIADGARCFRGERERERDSSLLFTLSRITGRNITKEGRRCDSKNRITRSTHKTRPLALVHK